MLRWPRCSRFHLRYCSWWGLRWPRCCPRFYLRYCSWWGLRRCILLIARDALILEKPVEFERERLTTNESLPHDDAKEEARARERSQSIPTISPPNSTHHNRQGPRWPRCCPRFHPRYCPLSAYLLLEKTPLELAWASRTSPSDLSGGVVFSRTSRETTSLPPFFLCTVAIVLRGICSLHRAPQVFTGLDNSHFA